jgi:hypothetical protein
MSNLPSGGPSIPASSIRSALSPEDDRLLDARQVAAKLGFLNDSFVITDRDGILA